MSDNEYMRKYMAERYTKRRAEAIARLGGSCVRCGAKDDLQFDHIDPATKHFTLADSGGTAADRFWAEVEKCQLLCRECHQEKSVEAGDLPRRATHGTLAMYRHHGCRCEVCKQAKSESNRKYKQDRKTCSVSSTG